MQSINTCTKFRFIGALIILIGVYTGDGEGGAVLKRAFMGLLLLHTESILEIGDHLFNCWRGKRIINLFKQECTLPKTGKLQQVKSGNILPEPVTTS